MEESHMVITFYDAEGNTDSQFVVEVEENTSIIFNDNLPLVRKLEIRFVSEEEASRTEVIV